jgi:release factor glutamine methyltransferase
MPEHLTVKLASGAVDIECPEGVHVPGPASLDLADYLAICPGASLLDLGCGTGLYAVAAARKGLPDVWATDVDGRACDAARANAARNGVQVNVLQGSLFEPVGDRRFDIIVSNPPQTPAPEEARGAKFGGPDGLRLFEPLLHEAPRHLTEGGKLLTFAISFVDMKRFLQLLSRDFHFSNVRQTPRPFTRGEYDAYWPGLFDFLADRRRRGLCEFEEDGDRFVFWVRHYVAWLR